MPPYPSPAPATGFQFYLRYARAARGCVELLAYGTFQFYLRYASRRLPAWPGPACAPFNSILDMRYRIIENEAVAEELFQFYLRYAEQDATGASRSLRPVPFNSI